MMKKIIVPALLCALLGTATAQNESVWNSRKSGWQFLTQEQREQVFRYAEGYKAYMHVARTALASNREVIRMARAAGFSEFTDPAQVRPGARLIINGRDRAVILAVVGSEPILDGLRLVVTHQDSPHINRPVAIKVLSDIFAADPEQLVRFAREAKPLASLNNPNIAAINTPSFIPR